MSAMTFAITAWALHSSLHPFQTESFSQPKQNVVLWQRFSRPTDSSLLWDMLKEHLRSFSTVKHWRIFQDRGILQFYSASSMVDMLSFVPRDKVFSSMLNNWCFSRGSLHTQKLICLPPKRNEALKWKQEDSTERDFRWTKSPFQRSSSWSSLFRRVNDRQWSFANVVASCFSSLVHWITLQMGRRQCPGATEAAYSTGTLRLTDACEDAVVNTAEDISYPLDITN